ncbi:MAG TPA: thioredoxin domain-containing protein [Gemmatimonadaceae bacterium]|nr:thioredoxin domain-containing protein [Gemmatimonadaceae bacterium]
MPNRLATETSPYLLQHAGNPVDWYPWSPEALERAKAENKPILLSIGYAACHWCHVMAHESFEDDTTAALMNERFVNIKVDREERPDLDSIYMQAVQAMTGHGGWPMTVFLTPDGAPFYGGTYYPREDRHGIPSFKRILTAVSEAYRAKPAEVAATVDALRDLYVATQPVAGEPISAALLDGAYHFMSRAYDEAYGGFGSAPKFPQTMSLEFLLTHWARRGIENALSMAEQSFLRMARGGIYDQVGGGFARYAVDRVWLVPHFEKMLYDNALLIRLGTRLWQATKNAEVKRIVAETIRWAAREMRSPEGGFYSSLDADSEGHEGKFYVWDAAELDSILGGDAAIMRAYWGATEGGNFEGKNILSVASADPRALARQFSIDVAQLEPIVERAKAKLYEVRSKRVWPGRDDKILASWNGLAVRALAEAARAFGDDEFTALALNGATFLFDRLVVDGRVLRSYSGGRARIAGYLEDHAAAGLAALAVYELTFDDRWLARARELGASMTRWFWNEAEGTFFDTAADHEALITRPRDVYDNATPSGTSLAVELLLRLAELFDERGAYDRAAKVANSIAPAVARYPLAFGQMLCNADMLVNGAVELAIVGDPTRPDFQAMAEAAATRYVPSFIVAGGPESGANAGVALLADRTTIDGKATAYLCRNRVCELPATGVEQLQNGFDRLAMPVPT